MEIRNTETRALKEAIETMNKLVLAYVLHKNAILPDTRLKFEIEARQQFKWLVEYAEKTQDSGVVWAVREARDVLRLMESNVWRLVREALLNSLQQHTPEQLKNQAYLARYVGCSVEWAESYSRK